jgi:hypothetical protein
MADMAFRMGGMGGSVGLKVIARRLGYISKIHITHK